VDYTGEKFLKKWKICLMPKCNLMLNHLAIIDEFGYISPCCIFSRRNEINQFKDFRINTIEDTDLNNVLKSKKWSDFRDEMESDTFIPECKNCKTPESLGRASQRQWYNTAYPVSDPLFLEDLEISLDFTCNMMCRICRPGQSSKWKSATTLLEKLSKISEDIDGIYNVGKNVDSYGKSIENIIKNTDFSKLKRIHIVGGEPFYSKKLKPFLEKITTDTKIEELTIKFNTNGSIFPSDEMLNTLLKAKSLEINFSIDAIGDLASVIRYGVEWQTIHDNICKWIKLRETHRNIKLSLHTVISVLNINVLQSILDYIFENNLEFSYYVLQFPDFLSMYQIPTTIREKWKVKLSSEKYQHRNGIIDFVNSIIVEEHKFESTHDVFLNAMNDMDDYQNVKFKTHNSEIIEVIEKLRETPNEF
jgi:radical SAM protein with 4Fe4S-binding SPASM domain